MGRALPRSEARSSVNLAGKYRLIAELGQGGMATVYLAVALGDSGFRKLAVVKLLRTEFAVDEEFIQMFLDEARLCARLSHPNIVHTYDVGVEDGEHLIAMEYLDGVSLHAATAKLGRDPALFGFALRARVLLEVVEGLRYAHELTDYDGQSLQIVHRDVTPHNIFLTYDGQVKLLDFGIAKAATSSVKTATGVIKGKLTYMAPEQARGEHVDARADLYAVGVMLWEAVTGRRRWPTGIPEPALFTRLATGELPESPNAASRGLPAEIDDIVMRALAPKPEDRYQTAAELRDVLDGVLRSVEPVSMRNLSTTLSKTFAEDRRRIRDVIEEQFRTIDTGGIPSEPHQLPAVPYPNVSTSSKAQAPPSQESGPDVVPSDTLVESQSRRITEPAPGLGAPLPFWSRSRIAVVAIGGLVATAFALGIAIPRTHSDTTTTPVSAIPASHETTAANPASTVGADAEIHAQARTSPEMPQPAAEAVSHTDGPGRHGPAAGATHNDGARSAPSAVRVSPSTSAAATSAEAPAKDSIPLRTPQGRPKVQLERDNPWP